MANILPPHPVRCGWRFDPDPYLRKPHQIRNVHDSTAAYSAPLMAPLGCRALLYDLRERDDYRAKQEATFEQLQQSGQFGIVGSIGASLITSTTVASWTDTGWVDRSWTRADAPGAPMPLSHSDPVTRSPRPVADEGDHDQRSAGRNLRDA